MAAQKILFLNPRTVYSSHSSTREQELLQSHAKSHAARVAQQRSRLIRRRTPAPQTSIRAGQLQDLTAPGPPPRLGTPLTLLRKGNSDPFASYAIEVTPAVNDIVNFFNTYYAVAAHQPYLSVPSFSANVVQDTASRVLQNDCSAQAFLLSFITLKSNVLPADLALQQEQLRLNRQALASLHSNMRNVRVESDAVLGALKFLFMAAAFAGNIFEATMHGTMLKDQLFRKYLVNHESLDLGLLMHIVYVDGQLALKHLTHTIFDMEWVEGMLQPALSAAESFMEPFLPQIVGTLDHSIDDTCLRKLFEHIRKGQYLRTKIVADTNKRALFSLWLGIRSGTIQPHIANYYHRVQRILSTNKLSTEDRFAWLTRCTMALALSLLVNTPESMALYRLRSPGGDRIIGRLREMVGEIQFTSKYLSSDIIMKYQHAHLWTMGICAKDEQRKLRDLTRTEWQASRNTWFTRTFALQACQLKLITWDALRNVIKRFVYIDMPPHGSTWVEDAINQVVRDQAAWYDSPRRSVTMFQ